MKTDKKIDWFLFIYLMTIFVGIIASSILFAIFKKSDGYLFYLVLSLVSITLTAFYLFIKRTWYLYICIAPVYHFYIFWSVLLIGLNRGRVFDDSFLIINSIVIPLESLIFVILLTLKIVKESKHNSKECLKSVNDNSK